MFQIDQFVHTLQYGDAISGEALSVQRILREIGHQSEIYSVNTHEKLKGIPKQMSEYRYDTKRDALILHYSISSPQNSIYLNSTKCKRFLIYHNLTPVKWFTAYNERVAQDLINGKAELPSLVNQTDYCLADSEFNSIELSEFGAKNPRVLPLLFDNIRLDTPPNEGIIQALNASKTKQDQGKNILHVGRLAPNKCIEDIIKGFYFYHHKHDQTSRLWLVGHDTDTEIYSFELRRLVEELRLKEFVFFVGSVSNDELLGFYQASDLYLCMSEHEGFCVPLIEALHFSLPVIAFSSSAIPETLGSAGVLIQNKDPLELALIMKRLLSDPRLRKDLIDRGKTQVQKFSLEAFKQKLTAEIIEKL